MRMKYRPLLLGMSALAAIALSGCRASKPPETFRQPLLRSSGSIAASREASGGIMDFTNERTPKTPESLEVSRVNTGAKLMIVRSGASLFIGSPQAPATLTLYSDYDCPYCRQFMVEDLPWLERTYVEPGKLRVERLFVPMSSAGDLMARAALCAVDQNRFRELDAQFASTPLISDKQLWATLKSAGVKQTKEFSKCLSAEATTLLLEAQKARAEEAGVKRVPTFALQQKTWLGLLTREELKRTIEAAMRN